MLKQFPLKIYCDANVDYRKKGEAMKPIGVSAVAVGTTMKKGILFLQ